MQLPHLLQKTFVAALLASVLALACWIRIPSGEQCPDGQFTETDGYFYYWQAKLISEHGRLPARDMHRWLPVGRDLGQTLNLYGYVLAYAHKTTAFCFPNVSLYHVVLYMPVICFCIGLGAVCLLLYQTHGWVFSTIAGVILATLPGSIERSTTGFGDRDAWCLMTGILTVITYLISLRAEHPHNRLLWTLVSGFTVFLGGISWEGFGVFLSVIIVVEIWRFLTSETEEGFGLYVLWVCCFVPTLYFVSPAYRHGYGFAEHLAAFVLLPPVVLLSIRALRYLLISKVDILCQHARTLSLGLTLGCLTLAMGYVLLQHQTFASTTVPLSQSALMQAMTELRAPHYGYWVFRYGTVFIFGSLGFILISVTLWKQHGILLSIPLALFTLFSFFRQPLDKLWGEPFGNALFGIAIAGCALAILFVAWQLKNKVSSSELVSITFTIWFIAWIALSRDAKRYDFFIGVALAFGTAAVIYHIAETLSQRLRHSVYLINTFQETLKPNILKTGVAAILLILLMCLPPQHAHTYRSRYTAEEMRAATPSLKVAMAMFWMKAKLPRTTIVAAHWAYGSQLNVLAGVKTITDQDTYIPHWIDLYNQHVHKATSEREALEYLKTHGATHIMLTKKDPHNSLLHGELSNAFREVYPKAKFADAIVKVWELRYPSNIKTDMKYLKTGFPEIDADLQRK
ncbi:hypothetical protein C6503_26805 [Candidatus Poribacteria bacterium]|nr:MAG: hypothetical protein C6503_26805 [Candidatus Poribacteria bacterium]